MKVSELFEEEDDFDRRHVRGEFIPEDLWGEWHDILANNMHALKQFENENTSHSIGGNFRAGVSGKVKMRTNYSQHYHYGGSRNWDYMLEIGNNLKDGDKKFDTLKAARDVLNDLRAEAESMKADIKWAGSEKDTFFATIGDTKFTATYEYGTNFTWVGITKT